MYLDLTPYCSATLPGARSHAPVLFLLGHSHKGPTGTESQPPPPPPHPHPTPELCGECHFILPRIARRAFFSVGPQSRKSGFCNLQPMAETPSVLRRRLPTAASSARTDIPGTWSRSCSTATHPLPRLPAQPCAHVWPQNHDTSVCCHRCSLQKGPADARVSANTAVSATSDDVLSSEVQTALPLLHPSAVPAKVLFVSFFFSPTPATKRPPIFHPFLTWSLRLLVFFRFNSNQPQLNTCATCWPKTVTASGVEAKR